MTEEDFQKLKFARGVEASTIILSIVWKALDASSIEEANSLEEFAERMYLEASDQPTQGLVSEKGYHAGQLMGMSRMIRLKVGREAATALGTAIAGRAKIGTKNK